MKLQNLDVIPESHYNLISITGLMEEDHKVTGNKIDGNTVQKGGRVIKFHIRVKTPKGVLSCTFMKWPEPDSNIAVGFSNGNPAKQIIVSVWERLKPAIE